MHRPVFQTLALLGLLLQAVPCAAADTAAADVESAVDLPGLEAQVVANNPEIKAAALRWRAAQARAPQAGALPDPLINTGYHNESFSQFTLGSSEFSWVRVGAEQEVPFPGKLGLKQGIAEREADREGAVHHATILSALTRLRVAYDDYYLAHKSIDILRNSKTVLEQLTQAAESRYRLGEGVQQDVARAQLEQSILLGRLLTQEQARQSAAAMLNALLNRPPTSPLGVPAPVEQRPLAYSLDQLETLATERSPQVQAATFDVTRAETNLDLAKRQYYPDFVVRADYFNKGSLTPEWELGAGIRVPLYFTQKQTPGVQEAAAAVGGAREARQGVRQDVLARLKDFHAQATSAQRLVELYGRVVRPQAELSLDSASAAYQVGKVDFLTVVNNFTTLNEYRLRYYEEVANYDKALARLDEAAGILPDAVQGGTTP